MKKTPAIERFIKKLVIDPKSGCWLWQGFTNRKGYAMFGVLPGIAKLAHRWSYEYFVGPIPAGLTIDHVVARGCYNRHCVNPAHLEAVTQGENNRRSSRVGQPQCIHGHAYTPENTYNAANGTRQCRTCQRDRSRARRAKAKLAANTNSIA